MSNTSKRSDQPRRFYKDAAVAPAEAGFAVTLDGRAAKTPAGVRLIVPSEGLARLLIDEWAAQGEQIDFSTMPATRLAFTAIDRTAGARDAVAGEVARLAAADHLCYFAETPTSLVERQERLWGPWLAWAETTSGLALIRARGLTHQAQPPETLARAKALAEAEDDFALSGLAFAAGLYGSAVLGFAVLRRALSAEAAFDLSRLDEAFQEERWGVDHEAAARTALLRADARMIDDWFEALKAKPDQAKV
jgi:chaperone required for assembly of F1-ATPase